MLCTRTNVTTVQKTCKQCDEVFSFVYEPNGKGSGNTLRQQCCSERCKRLRRKSRKSLKLVTRLTKSCVVCAEDFYVPVSLSKQKTCSNACRYKYASLTRDITHFVFTCFACDSRFETRNKRQKYCSLTCGKRAKVDQVERICEMCAKKFTTKRSYVPRFCSKQCLNEAQSCGKVISHVNGRSGYRSDIIDSPYFKSSFEADYCRYCVVVLGEKPQYECKTFRVVVNGKERCYTPDFWFERDNRFVELKGVEEDDSIFSKKLNSNSNARNELVSSGQPITLIYMNDFYSMLKRDGLYETIENLENRDYVGTKHLIIKHSKN